MNNFSIIVAADKNNGIGINGDLAWYLSSDLKYFKKITTTVLDSNKINAVIMGRTTWESIPDKYKPLTGRINCVLSSRDLDLPEGVKLFSSLESCLNHLSQNKEVENIFVIGGAQLYNYSINSKYLERIYLTEVLNSFKCDTFFPKIPEGFKKIEEGEVLEEDGIKFRFNRFEY